MHCNNNHRKGCSIQELVKELKLLSRKELLIKWCDIFDMPAPMNLNKPYLIRHIGWQIKFGGLTASTQKQIDKLVEQYIKNKALKNIDIKRVQKFVVTVGTRFIRDFKGRKHEVTALDNGFSYNGKTYRSLSAIANEITGTRWNGKKFFGICN